MIISQTTFGQGKKVVWEWKQLPAIPDAIGFAGAYSGIVEGQLIVLGGANFPDGKAPWDGGKKVWTDQVFMLKDETQQNWIKGTPLPQPMGYGASISYENKMYMAGGSNELEHLNEVYEVSWNFEINNLTCKLINHLPKPIANCASILIGDYWYIAGGIESPSSKEASSICWKLNMKNPEAGWEDCAALPGKGRMLAILGENGKQPFILSGVALINGQREYLTDAYILKGELWEKVTDLPQSVAAASSPGYYDTITNSFFVFGGDDGELANANLKENHPGFSNKILQFCTEKGEWFNNPIPEGNSSSELKFPVTTNSTIWNGKLVIPMGEIRPGIRTPQVLIGNIKGEK